MQLKNNKRHWRLINLVLIIIGLITPWFGDEFDVQSIPPELTIGWEFISATGYQVVERLLEYGFEIRMVPFMLIGLSAILTTLYLIFNLLSIIEERKFKIDKIIPVVLIGTVLAFSFPVLFTRPLIGFWVFTLGLLSCALLEWKRMKEISN